jgi:hypothetical protein
MEPNVGSREWYDDVTAGDWTIARKPTHTKRQAALSSRAARSVEIDRILQKELSDPKNIGESLNVVFRTNWAGRRAA